MFQRLKGAIDSRIAEEQARQRGSQESLSRSNSRTQRSSSRTVPLNRRTIRSEERESENGKPLTKGPDPLEFEPEFIIDGDSTPSRSNTPRPSQGLGSDAAANGAPAEAPPEHIIKVSQEEDGEKDAPASSAELPTDVRVKLRKLEKLESKYHELLRSYRIAHARVLSIEPFETSLRENTPLTSISDPGALVEYLNQVNLKGDMVLDELKRVSSERDNLKQKLEKVEQSTKDAWDEVTSLRQGNELCKNGDKAAERNGLVFAEKQPAHSNDNVDSDLLRVTVKSPTASVKSRTPSIPSLSLFSPRSKASESPVVREGSEDLFSYDSELPRMESELGQRQEKIITLEHEVKSLKGDLAVARESTQSMVQTLEEATRESNVLREIKDRSLKEAEEQRSSSENLLDQIKAKLHETEANLEKLQNEHGSCNNGQVPELEKQLGDANAELESLRSRVRQSNGDASQAQQLGHNLKTMESKVADLEAERKQDAKRIETLNGLVKSVRAQLEDLEDKNGKLVAELEVVGTQKQSKTNSTDNLPTQSTAEGLATTADASIPGRKKNKKKKRGGRPDPEQAKEQNSNVIQSSATEKSKEIEGGTDSHDTMTRLQEELGQLRKLLEEKDAAIERIHGRLKDQDELKDEIESLRDDIINVGQEHVQAKEKVKELTTGKATLETTVESLEKELTDLRATQASIAAGSDSKYKDLAVQFEELKTKAATLQTDLSAAQQLASSRFKDLSDLKSALQKAQPELTTLRSEVSELRFVRETLGKRTEDFTRLETRHEEMGSEVAGLKQAISERGSDIKTLNQKIAQGESARLKAEESSSRARQEVQRLEIERRQATESLDRLSKDLAKAREDLTNTSSKFRELELQIAQLDRDNEGLKEDIELKTAQHASAQSLMGSMRDQTAEMAMQMKEARDRCESLEEEVADAHRLLGERSREGETMRRLLADVEGRADARIRDMKERMDTAVEERDRAEDEASTMGRRRARELEDLRNKFRDTERSLKRAEEDKEELEAAQRDWKRRREELESKTEQSTQEADEIRRAMGELRDALDESERQAREVEKQKFELRRSVEDTQHRLEKLQKSNKSMADEIRTIQSAKTKGSDPEAQSSRSSIDSNLSRARLGSPVPKGRAGSAALIDPPSGQGAAPIDFVYLKNVLLQFLEQKDKKHQQQLIPVLGMLLHFDRKDEQKWMSVITSK